MFKGIIGKKIWEDKYQYNGESYDEFLDRVSGGNKHIRWLLDNNIVSFAGRILSSRGTGRRATLSNCYNLGEIDDSIKSLFDQNTDLAVTLKAGGGVGTGISNMRPAYAPTNNAARTSSGPVSFMPQISRTIKSIGQEGRRGAGIIWMIWHHIDIFKFIRAKRAVPDLMSMDFKTSSTEDIHAAINKAIDEDISQANITVMLDDEIMSAAERNETVTLRFDEPVHGKQWRKEAVAKDILYAIAKNNRDYAEPGVAFMDRVHNHHLLQHHPEYIITGFNPCGEQPLPDYASCNLAPINLAALVKAPYTSNARFDIDTFKHAIKHMVPEMDLLLDEGLEYHPLPQQKEVVKDFRQIGLGYMGVADMFIKLGIRYGSPEAVSFIRELTRIMFNEAVRASAYQAAHKGQYRKFRLDVIEQSDMFKQLDEDVQQLVRRHGMRNSHLLSIAPNGSTATIKEISGGIEPLYSIYTVRHTKSLKGGEKSFTIINPTVQELMDRKGISSIKDLPDYVVDAMQVKPEEHIAMQAAAQEWVDSAISKTINFDESYDEDDLVDTIMLAWKSGVKGCTFFMVGGKLKPILEKLTCPECGQPAEITEGCKKCTACGWSACEL